MRFQTFLYLLLLVALISNCKSRPSSGSSSAVGIDTTFIVNTAETPFPGELMWKARWREGTEDNVVLVSHSIDYADGDGYDALFARRFVQIGQKWIPQWVFRDTVRGNGCDLGILLLRPYCDVIDFDGDGKQEVLITYARENRCDASILETKMVVNKGTKSGAIEGFTQLYLGPPEAVMNEFLRENGQEPVQYKRITPELKAMGKQITVKASQQWDAMLEWDEKENRQD